MNCPRGDQTGQGLCGYKRQTLVGDKMAGPSWEQGGSFPDLARGGYALFQDGTPVDIVLTRSAFHRV